MSRETELSELFADCSELEIGVPIIISSFIRLPPLCHLRLRMSLEGRYYSFGQKTCYYFPNTIA